MHAISTREINPASCRTAILWLLLYPPR